MKPTYSILIGFSLACSVFGQEEPAASGLDDKVRKAIEEFNRLKKQGAEPEKEVVVVLPPPGPASEPADAKPPVAVPVEEPAAEEEEPKLVTGKSPAEEPKPSAVEAAEAEPEALQDSAPEEKEGLEIHVESIREGSGKADPGKIKLKASFPAKSLTPAPDGWILEKSEQAPALHKEVTLRPGKTISLNIRPHVLSPDSDGANTFAVVEPGFDVAEGYRQTNTVSAILGNSVAQLDRDSLLLGNAISDLHQLLASLPKPKPMPEPEPARKTAPKR